MFSVQAAQDAVQQVADSSKETVNTGNMFAPLSLKPHDGTVGHVIFSRLELENRAWMSEGEKLVS